MKQYRIGYTQGVFDMFHIGHLNLLKRAKEQCDFLIVGVNSDELVMQYKQKTPIIRETERKAIIENIKCVDQAEIVDTLDKLNAWNRFHFDAIFIGSDWKGNSRWEETGRQLRQVGADLVYLPYTDGISSTILRKDADQKVEG